MQSIKSKVIEWVTKQIKDSYIDSEKESIKDLYHRFKIKGFCDDPEIFLVVTRLGLEWGYDTYVWDGPATPVPTKRIIRNLSWDTLNSLNVEERKDKIIYEMVKAVDSKKREYLRCKFCNNKMHSTEFYDNTTCIICAENHLGIYIVY
ncbi:hypothetical protein [Fictibacillus halophilus]|uniref:hypothetical protein n=1 Tax=Fictibacillus halophilus TaxID=1610490 RepID=UPI001CFA1ACD|nr:hypothetical protein [Fictibacillus halophilus]